jgi:hypothetical protein
MAGVRPKKKRGLLLACFNNSSTFRALKASLLSSSTLPFTSRFNRDPLMVILV